MGRNARSSLARSQVVGDVRGQVSALDLRVHATPITTRGEPLTVSAIGDICVHTCSDARNKL